MSVLKKQAGEGEPQKEVLGLYISDWEGERESRKKLERFKTKAKTKEI